MLSLKNVVGRCTQQHKRLNPNISVHFMDLYLGVGEKLFGF